MVYEWNDATGDLAMVAAAGVVWLLTSSWRLIVAFLAGQTAWSIIGGMRQDHAQVTRF